MDSSSHMLRWQHVSQTFYDIIWAISATSSLIDFTWLHKFSVGMRQHDVCACDMFVVVCGCINIRYPNIISSVGALQMRSHDCGKFIRVNKVSLETILHHSKWKISMMVRTFGATSTIIVLDGWILFILSQSFGKWWVSVCRCTQYQCF